MLFVMVMDNCRLYVGQVVIRDQLVIRQPRLSLCDVSQSTSWLLLSPSCCCCCCKHCTMSLILHLFVVIAVFASATEAQDDVIDEG